MDLLNLLLLLLRPLKNDYAGGWIGKSIRGYSRERERERERVDGAVGDDAFLTSILGIG